MKTQDLQQIGQLLDEKIGTILDEKLDARLKPIQDELKKHGKILEEHDKSLKALKKNQDAMLKMLDKEQMSQRKRLAALEEQAGLAA